MRIATAHRFIKLFLNRSLWSIGVVLWQLVACSTPRVTTPATLIQPPTLPDLQTSIIQVPLVFPTAQLKALLYRRMASPLLTGTTPEYHFKIANRKPAESKNWLDRWAKPLLEWVDETIDASATFRYRLDLSELELWFEGETVHIDLLIDLQTEAQWKNGIKWQGKKQSFSTSTACPLQLRVHLDGRLVLTEAAELLLTLDQEQAQFEITKFCSSNILQQVNWPELLQPMVQPVLADVSKAINGALAQQVQALLQSKQGQAYRNLRPYIDRAASYLNTPYALQPGIWLQPNVQQLFVSPIYGVGKGVDNRLEWSVGAVAKPLVVVQEKVPPSAILPPVTFGVKTPQAQSKLYVKGQLPLKNAAAQLKSYLQEYIKQHHAHYGYQIGEVRLYPKGARAIIAIELLQAERPKKNATLYLAGVPQFDATSREFYLEDIRFTAQSKNLLLHLAKWLHQGQLMEQLQKNARFDASADLQRIEQELQHIDVRQAMGRLYGTLTDLQVVQTGISQDYFEAYLLAKGILKAEVYWHVW